uniref:Uncharacterized protein n=1 Tax=Triticum aestivum TaxID=4565 RepID=A0A077S7P7_WHEAT|nr:unnamed protein product [Triticum aestivum]
MTNVKPMLCGKDGDDPNGNLEEFFAGCSYIETWVDTMTKNTYLTEVASYNSVLGVLKLEKRKEENKEKLENEEDDNKKLIQKGERQFHVLRNCDVHIPEKAAKVNQVTCFVPSIIIYIVPSDLYSSFQDGICPFRLTWCDYIRTCYFRKYLSFVQSRMESYLKPTR